MYYDAKSNTFVPRPCPKCKNETVVTPKKQKDSPHQISCSACGLNFGYFCPICPSLFAKKSLLEEHYQVHDNLLKTYFSKTLKTKQSTCCIEDCKHKLRHKDSLLHHQNHVLLFNSSLSLKKRQNEIQERQEKERDAHTPKKQRKTIDNSEDSTKKVEENQEQEPILPNAPENEDNDYFPDNGYNSSEEEQISVTTHPSLLEDQNLSKIIERQPVSDLTEEGSENNEERVLFFDIQFGEF